MSTVAKSSYPNLTQASTNVFCTENSGSSMCSSYAEVSILKRGFTISKSSLTVLMQSFSFSTKGKNYLSQAHKWNIFTEKPLDKDTEHPRRDGGLWEPNDRSLLKSKTAGRAQLSNTYIRNNKWNSQYSHNFRHGHVKLHFWNCRHLMFHRLQNNTAMSVKHRLFCTFKTFKGVAAPALC